MRQLIELVLRYKILLTFLLLEFISIALVVQNNSFQSAVAFTLMREVTGGLYTAYNSSTDYIRLKKVNDDLAMENAILRELLANNKVNIPTKIPKSTAEQYEFINAKVINNTLIYANNYITIDKGSNDGIQAGMGVITSTGVVGKVKSCSPNFSIIYSLLHADLMISSTLKKTNTTCFAKWNQKDYTKANLLYVARHIQVKAGDTVVTSGYNTVYPENYMIGTVQSVKKTLENVYLEISVKLSTDFSNISHVYVLKNRKQAELDSLQKADVTKEKLLTE
jgi:rod shape-determining protein MreC